MTRPLKYEDFCEKKTAVLPIELSFSCYMILGTRAYENKLQIAFILNECTIQALCSLSESNLTVDVACIANSVALRKACRTSKVLCASVLI